jgi:hypothetical protein
MTAEPFESPANVNNCRRRIRWLVAAHVAATGCALASKYIWPWPYLDVAGSLEFAQVMLLAIWFALGRGGWKARLLKNLTCVAIAAAAKEGPVAAQLLFSGWNYLIEILCMQGMLTSMAWITAASGVAAARRWGPRFALVKLSPRSHSSSTTQFSIRSLLLATMLTAGVLAVVRLTRTYFDPRQVENVFLAFCIIAPLVAVYSSVLAVAYVWAGLGTANLPLRIAVAVILQCGFTALLLVAFSQEWKSWMFMVYLATQLCETMVIIGSLLVVRSCGFRVVSRAAASSDGVPPNDSAPAPHPLD